MPRARISTAGIDIAKPGFDVDTAPLDKMTFSSSLVAARIRQTGETVVSRYSGFMDTHCARAIVPLNQVYVNPPMVLVSGLYADGTTEQSIAIHDSIPLNPGTARRIPTYSVEVFNDRFELYTYWVDWNFGVIDPYPHVWRYWVLANNLE